MAKLGIGQLGDVLHLLRKHQVDATRYHPLGLSLGLSDNTLKVIERDHRGDTDRCLSECLSAWLRKADSEDDPSWDTLIAALRSIGEQAGADGIDDERKQSQAVSILSTHQIWLSQLLIDHDPVFISVGDLLNKEKVLSDEALANIQSARRPAERKRVLLAAVREAVQINYQHLETFGTVLCRSSNTNNVRLGKIILKDYRALITERSIAEDLEDDDQMFNTDTPSSETLPTTSPNVEVHVPQCMSPEFSSIRASFGRMFYNVRKIITKSPPSLEELKVFLEDCYHFLESLLADINDLSSLLRLIKKNCTLIDIKPLDAIVQEFTITEAERYIEEYKTTLKEFCQSISIELCLKERFEAVKTHPSLRCEEAIYVFDWEPEEHTLKDITDILSKASHRLVKIKYIERVQSITVTCTFPHSLTGAVFAKALEGLDMLKKNGLVQLTVGYCTVWKRGSEAGTCTVLDDELEKDLKIVKSTTERDEEQNEELRQKEAELEHARELLEKKNDELMRCKEKSNQVIADLNVLIAKRTKSESGKANDLEKKEQECVLYKRDVEIERNNRQRIHEQLDEVTGQCEALMQTLTEAEHYRQQLVERNMKLEDENATLKELVQPLSEEAEKVKTHEEEIPAQVNVTARREVLELTEENARLQASLQGSAQHEEVIQRLKLGVTKLRQTIEVLNERNEDQLIRIHQLAHEKEIQRLNLEVIKLRRTNEVLNERYKEQLTRIRQLAHEKEGIAAQKKQVELQLHNTAKLLGPQTAPVNDKPVSDLKAQVDRLHSQLQQQELEMESLREENTELNRQCEEYAQNQLPPGSTHQHRFYQDNLDRMQRDYDNLKARYDKLDSEKEEVAKELAKTTRRSRGERETYDKERKEWQQREIELALINHQRYSEIQELKGQLSVLTKGVAPKRVSFSVPDIESSQPKSGEAPVSMLKRDPVTEPITASTLEDIEKLREEIQKMRVTVKEVEDDSRRKKKTSLHEN